MQSGAFLHLVVTLTALVARIAHLSSAVRSVLSALHTECAHLLATLYVRNKWPCFRSDAKITSSLLVQPTEASHNLVPLLPPPPPQLDGEDTKVSGSPLEHSRRTVPDADLDVYVDFGEAVARTPGLTSRPKSGSAPPVLPDLSPVHDATFAPVIRAQRPGECKALGSSQLCADCQFQPVWPMDSRHCHRRRCRSCPAAFGSWTFVTRRYFCGGEEAEPRQAAFKFPHHRRRAEREKGPQTEKVTARRD
jgi:hypothetical protein